MKKLFALFFLPALILAGIGKVSALKGTAQALRNGTAIPLHLGSSIENHDRISTSENSRVQIILNDNTTVTVGENSRYSFDDYLFDGTGSSRARMSIERGFFRVVSGNIKKVARKRFTVKTQSAVIGIRGTVFDGLIKNGYEKIKCWSGMIYLKTPGGILNISAGKMGIWKNRKWGFRKFAVKVKQRKTTNKNNALMARRLKKELLHTRWTYKRNKRRRKRNHGGQISGGGRRGRRLFGNDR